MFSDSPHSLEVQEAQHNHNDVKYQGHCQKDHEDYLHCCERSGVVGGGS